MVCMTSSVATQERKACESRRHALPLQDQGRIVQTNEVRNESKADSFCTSQCPDPLPSIAIPLSFEDLPGSLYLLGVSRVWML